MIIYSKRFELLPKPITNFGYPILNFHTLSYTYCARHRMVPHLLPKGYLSGFYIVASSEKTIFMLLHRHPCNNRLAFLACVQGLMVLLDSTIC